jgi:predicted molibdopterin-dependent oxidoreductase YjgC
LEACANREIDVLYLVGVDPLRDVPNADLVHRALGNVRHVVVQSLELGALEAFADAFLPAAAWVEREGHVTDWEGRSQPIRPVRGPAGVSRPDWEIFAGLAEAVGRPLGFAKLDALRSEAAGLLEPRAVPARSTAWTGTGRPQRLGELTLLSYPLLVDEGRLSEGAAELKAALGEGAFVEVHPEDAEKHGVSDAGRAVVRTDAGEAVLPVRVTEHVAQGAVFVPFNQPGLGANALLSGSFTTSARIEAASAEAEPVDRVVEGAA